MRTYLKDYGYIAPRSLDEALEAMASGTSLRPLAGGTDLMVYLDAGALAPTTFLDLQAIPEIQTRLLWNDGLTLSALATYADVRGDLQIRERFPLLARAAREVGSLAVQTRGTWAGNVANGSPAADGVPALMAYDAVVETRSRSGARRIPLAELYRGYKDLDLRPDELITAIHVPPPPTNRYEYFRKVGARRFQAIGKTLLTGWLSRDGDGSVSDVRIVLASVAPSTLRAARTEAALRGRPLSPTTVEEACAAVDEEIQPIDDIRSTARYRRRVTKNLLREFLRL